MVVLDVLITDFTQHFNLSEVIEFGSVKTELLRCASNRGNPEGIPAVSSKSVPKARPLQTITLKRLECHYQCPVPLFFFMAK